MKGEERNVLENRPWIGMDVHKENFSAALYVAPRPGAPDLKSMPTKEFKRDAQGVAACMEWAGKLLAKSRPGCPAPRVCMEATGRYSIDLAQEVLRQCPQWEPAIANPRFVKKHGESMGQRCKSDKADARVCACYGAERQPRPYSPLEPAFQEVQELTRERKSIVELRVSLMNRMAETGVSKPAKKSQAQLMKQYDKLVDKLDAAIAEAFKEIPELRTDAQAVSQIPGVAEVISSVTIGELGDLRKYHTSRSISAAVGANPRVVESGKHKGKTRMSKQGNIRVRTMLYCAAMACLKTKDDHCLKRFYNQLVKRGKTHMQALGALMRKIIVLMRALVISGKPFDPDYDLKKRLSMGSPKKQPQPVHNLA
jgi:transposase